ncbi:MAG: 30S ribosomal protein S3 [Candidatus Kaiserbacteria bacterium]|nr:30S ribosomal protein S3 [Candidatus Kaiserbacteria bacterium]
MTHSSHPYGFRLGITRDWRTQWFAADRKKYRALLREDYHIRTFLEKELDNKMVSSILFERDRDTLVITIKTARPGLIIGREGVGIEELIQKVKQFSRRNGLNDLIKIRVEEVRHAEQDAMLVAESVVESLKRHMHPRRLIKHTVEKVMANRNVQGCRVTISGRLGGSEIARSEEVKKGNIPLQTLRADIDYAQKEAVLPYGTLGIKVWVYKGEIEQDNQERR